MGEASIYVRLCIGRVLSTTQIPVFLVYIQHMYTRLICLMGLVQYSLAKRKRKNIHIVQQSGRLQFDCEHRLLAAVTDGQRRRYRVKKRSKQQQKKKIRG